MLEFTTLLFLLCLIAFRSEIIKEPHLAVDSPRGTEPREIQRSRMPVKTKPLAKNLKRLANLLRNVPRPPHPLSERG